MKIKIIAAILVGIIIALAAGIVIFNSDISQGILEKKFVESQLQNATEQVASNINMKVSGDQDKLRIMTGILAKEKNLESFKNGNLKEALKEIAPSLSFTDINVCKVDGTAFDLEGKSLNTSFCPYFQRALLGDTTTSLTRFYQNDKELKVVYTAPIYNGKTVTGVLRIALDPEVIRKYMVINTFRGNEEAFILKRDGSILMHVDEDKSSEENFLNIAKNEKVEKTDLLDLEQVIKQGRSILTKLTFNGDAKYVSYKGIKDASDWGVMFTISEQKLHTLFKDERAASKTLINILMFICVLVFSLSLIAITIREILKSSKMEYLAYYDSGTGSINYNRFRVEATALINKNKNSGESYAVIQVAVDKYDYIREFFGMQESEKLLKNLAKNISAFLKDGELCSKSNTNSFNLLFRFHNKDELTDRISYMNSRLSGTDDSDIKNKKYEVLLHYGVYCLTKEDTDIDLIVDKAARALAGIKGDRKQLYEFYSNEVQSKAFDENEIEARMFTALDEKEFLVYLQPKFDLNTGRQVGAEALVRWMHPEKGLIYPGRFLGVFEKNGFIVKMDMYMLDIMCNWLKIWMGKGYRPLPLSLNISRLNLFDENFVSKLIGTLEQYGIPPQLINLEIAEQVVTDNIEILTALMSRLKKYGFLISMDAFGTGTASMNTLYHVPVDELKIERKFLLGAEKTDRGKNVIGSIIEMAKRLNIKVVSEGVENKVQAKMLQGLGCDMIQGFAFCEPMPIREYENYTYGPRASQNVIW